jgi:hypothetical protein
MRLANDPSFHCTCLLLLKCRGLRNLRQHYRQTGRKVATVPNGSNKKSGWIAISHSEMLEVGGFAEFLSEIDNLGRESLRCFAASASTYFIQRNIVAPPTSACFLST